MSEILNDKGEPVKEPPQEKVKTNDKGHLAVIKIGDVEYKVVNTVSLMEIVVHKLENGQEVSQVIAHEFMMADHKAYMVKNLTDAINTVMRAKKREGTIRLVSKAAMHKLFNNRLSNFLRNKK